MIYDDFKKIPARIWFEINSTGDLSLLIKKTQEKRKFKVSVSDLENSWAKIYNEYLKMFGIKNGALENLETQIKIAKLKAKWILTKDSYFQTLIKIESETLNFTEEQKGLSLDENLAKLGQFYKYELNADKISASQYYSHLYNAINAKV